MATPSLLERAKTGEAEAIAVLLNRHLQPKGLQVKAVRETYHLTLWVEAVSLPSADTVVPYIRRGIEQLNVPSLGILTIIGQSMDAAAPSWREEFSLLASYGQGGGAIDRQDGIEIEGSAPPSMADPSAPLTANASETKAAIDAAYRALNVPLGAPLPDVDAAYFTRKSLLIKQGKRDKIAAFQSAHKTLKQYLQTQAQPPTSQDLGDSRGEPTPAEHLKILFQQQGLPARVRLQDKHLEIQLPTDQIQRPHQVVAQIYTLLNNAGRAIVGSAEIEKVTVYGLNSAKKVVWKRVLAGSQLGLTDDDTDLFSFNNRYSNLFIFPALMGLAILMNAMPIVSALLFGIKIWFHEFGHATVAWLGGRKAIPLPIGWTNVGAERSLFVYLGLLGLLGLLYWSGRREQQRWPMVLAVVLGLLQFGMTWLMSPHSLDMWISFGGIGGEFYLCTLLMVSFYFPLPAYWRWDFYRYPVVLGAAFTFWGQLWLWKQIAQGRAVIPWGSLWGGEDHGDMNTLSAIYGWSDQRIIDTYNTLGNVCFVALLAVYVYFVLRHYRPTLFMHPQ